MYRLQRMSPATCYQLQLTCFIGGRDLDTVTPGEAGSSIKTPSQAAPEKSKADTSSAKACGYLWQLLYFSLWD